MLRELQFQRKRYSSSKSTQRFLLAADLQFCSNLPSKPDQLRCEMLEEVLLDSWSMHIMDRVSRDMAVNEHNSPKVTRSGHTTSSFVKGAPSNMILQYAKSWYQEYIPHTSHT